VNWQATSERVLMRRGAIGQIRRGRLAFVAEVRSLAHVLGQSVGRTFQSTCDAVLRGRPLRRRSQGPGLQGHRRPARSSAGPRLHRLRARQFRVRLVHLRHGRVDQRRERGAHGGGAGPRRDRRNRASDPARGAGAAIAEGDSFTIRAGCDKSLETCGAKFANVASFRGFPHTPGQDSVLRYATKDGGHEGGVL
jgi:Phage conserved hypothetical protein BR0599/Uncharacterized conserved protein (DUF2163)